MEITPLMYLGMAILMVIPVVLVILSLVLPYKAARVTSIVFAVFFFGFNLIGLPTYPSAYDQFLIIVGLGFNIITVWVAWKWRRTEVN